MDKEKIAEYEANATRVNDLLDKLQNGDFKLFNYIDNLSITNEEGEHVDVNVYVSVEDGDSGNKEPVGETKFVFNPNLGDSYNGDPIATPTTRTPKDGSYVVGFSVSIHDKPTYSDERLANEAGDIRFAMEHNAEAYIERGNKEMSYDEYLNSKSNAYSNRVEKVYHKRKLYKKDFSYPN